MPADRFDVLGPALSSIGTDAVAIVGGAPTDIFLFVEAGDGWVSASLYKEAGGSIHYFEPSQALYDDLLDLWEAEDTKKRWTEMQYAVVNGRFNARFEYDDMKLPGDGSIDRRERVLRARYGDKPIVYPPPSPDMKPYKPGP